MPNIRTTRVDRRLISLLTKEPQLIKYLENLGLDVQENIPDAIDDNSDDAAAAQLAADSAQSSASSALQAVRELSDTLATLEIPSPAVVSGISASLGNLELAIADLESRAAPRSLLDGMGRRLEELEAALSDIRAPIDPNAGKISYFEQSATGVALVSSTPANVTSFVLPAGTWELSGGVTFQPAAGTTQSIVQAGISTVSATMPGVGKLWTLQGSLQASATQSNGVPSQRLVFATATTVYLVALAAFAVSTMAVNGTIRAERVSP